jgi:hypothetical protein
VRIEENTFLVAGGGSGLGEATTHMLAASGARVVVSDLVKHIIENEMLNGEVIRLDGGFSGLTTSRMALMLPSATSRVTTLWGLPSPKLPTSRTVTHLRVGDQAPLRTTSRAVE